MTKSAILQNKQELHDKEFEAAIQHGSNLAVLVASLPADDAVKVTLLELAEKATLKQLYSLEEFLKNAYANTQTQDIDKKFQKGLSVLKKDIDRKEAKLQKAALKKLEKIEKKLKTKTKVKTKARKK